MILERKEGRYRRIFDERSTQKSYSWKRRILTSTLSSYMITARTKPFLSYMENVLNHMVENISYLENLYNFTKDRDKI